MLSKEIINRMDTDELRNYACKAGEYAESCEDMILACDNLNDVLRRAYNCLDYKHDTLMRKNCALESFRTVQNVLKEKYDPGTPVPKGDFSCD